METTQRRGGSNLFVPLLLIGMGILWLLGNFNFLSWDMLAVIGRLWPVMLIASGLHMVIGRNSTMGSLVVVGITVAMLGAGIWYYRADFGAGVALSDEAISQSLDGADRAEVHIGGGVGRFLVSASNSDELIEGELELGRNERVAQDFSVDGDTARYSLISRGSSSPSFWNFERGDRRVWDLRLNQSVPLELKVEAGVGESMLDLRSLNLTALDVDMGVGDMVLTLPTEGEFEATIDGGVGEATIRIPEDMAARIEVDTGLGDLDVDGAFERQGDVYVTEGYENATNRVDIQINMGVGEIQVEQIGN